MTGRQNISECAATVAIELDRKSPPKKSSGTIRNNGLLIDHQKKPSTKTTPSRAILFMSQLCGQNKRITLMDSMNLLPVNTDGGVGGPALGAFAGALFGSWFGDGFGGRGYGAAAPVAAAVDTSIVLDSINTLQSGVNSLALSNAQGFSGLNTAVLTSANGTNQGICNLGYQGAQNTFQVTNALTQGFSGLNTAIASQGYESRLATQALGAQMAECCCEIKGVVSAEGAATRALIDRYEYQNLQTQLCDAKAKISTLESNAFTTASNAHQTQVLLEHLRFAK